MNPQRVARIAKEFQNGPFTTEQVDALYTKVETRDREYRDYSLTPVERLLLTLELLRRYSRNQDVFAYEKLREKADALWPIVLGH